jgi:hypothetical protein
MRRKSVMPAFYKIDKERKLVISTAAGAFTLADGLAHQEKLRMDPDFDPGFSQLLDFTQATRIDLSEQDLWLLAQENIFSPKSRRAILVTGGVAYGLGRRFENLRETKGEEGIQVFRNLEQALDWVLAKRAAD